MSAGEVVIESIFVYVCMNCLILVGAILMLLLFQRTNTNNIHTKGSTPAGELSSEVPMAAAVLFYWRQS